jgi:hypothetical protein
MKVHAKLYFFPAVLAALLSLGAHAQNPGGNKAPADVSQEMNGSGQGATGTVSPGAKNNPTGSNSKPAQAGSASGKMPRAASDGHADTAKKAY